MWDTYEEYCSFMTSKNCEPLSKEIFERDYRRKSEEEKAAELLEHIPFVSRKKESFRNVEPTLSNHEAPRATAPMRVNLMDVPKVDRVAKVGKTINEVSEPKKRRSPAVSKTSLVGMSVEERKEHRNKLSRDRYKRDKENEDMQLSEEALIKRRQVCKNNYRKNRKARLEATRIRRENMTPEQKAEAKAYMSQWQKDNREHVNKVERERKQKKRNPQQQNNTFISVDQSYSA